MGTGELRIGNYVSDGHYGFMAVSLVDDRGWITLLPIGYVTHSPRVEASLVSPIKLTEEWLVKFGFEKREQKTILDYPIWVKDDSEYFFQADEGFYHNLVHSDNHQIEYVHQLQNLYFALTRTELQLQN